VKRFFVSLVFVVIWLRPAVFAAGHTSSRWHAVWRVSQAMLVAGNAADIASSWDKSEANPILRTGQRFSYGSMAIKLGILAGSLGAEHYMVRKYPEATPYVTVTNFGMAALMGVTAAHNMRVAPIP
jgi:hypothetical protein